jgi:arylamine N-acetyltransferase
MINIVSIGDSRYVVDVGFGANYCPIKPLRLIHDVQGSDNIAPAAVRLVWKAIEGNANQLQKLWVYQHRMSTDSEFKDMYCFTDVEFRPGDFELMNYYTSTNPKTVFTQMVMCTKMLLGDDEKKDEIVGVLILQRNLKKRIGSESQQLMDFKTEGDRVKALEEYFDITLSRAEQEAIKGTVAGIRNEGGS